MSVVSKRIRTLAGVAVLASAVLLPSVSTAESPDNDKALLALLAQAAFGAGQAGPGDAILYKWDTPVRVRMAGQAPSRFRDWAAAQIALLAALSGHPLAVVQDINADVVIQFVSSFQTVLDGAHNTVLRRYVNDADRLAGLLDGFRQVRAVCGGQLNASGASLRKAIIFIPLDQPPSVIHGCLAAQTLRVLGLPFAVAEGIQSVLSGASPYSHLTDLDSRLIKLVYSKNLLAGMSLGNALAAAKSALAQQLDQ